jgi:hypothetical protein
MDEKTVHLHPNDGFDLGLMTTEYVVRLHVGPQTDPQSIDEKAFIYGKVRLKNEVRPGHLELGLKSSERLDGSKQATVHYEPGERYGTLLVTPSR